MTFDVLPLPRHLRIKASASGPLEGLRRFQLACEARKLEHLPALSPTCYKLMEEDLSQAQLTKLISGDPALLAWVLGEADDGSLEAILSGLPEPELDLALCTSVAQGLYQDGILRFGGLRKWLWHHQALTGFAAQEIARALQGSTRLMSRARIAGLLHDLGWLVLLTVDEAIARKNLATLYSGAAPLTVIEHETLGTDHGDLGATLAETWGLPSWLVEVIADHQVMNKPLPDNLQGTGTQHLCPLVHQAERLVAEALEYKIPLIGDVSVRAEPAVLPLTQNIRTELITRIRLHAAHLDQLATRGYAQMPGLLKL